MPNVAYSAVEPYLYPFMRIVVGALLIPHGIEKLERGVSVFAANNPAKLGFYPPTLWGWAVVTIEVVGGACIALGLFTRFFAAAAAIELAIVAFGVHSAGWFWTGRGMEYAHTCGPACRQRRVTRMGRKTKRSSRGACLQRR